MVEKTKDESFTTALIVLGLDEFGKPHASAFAAEEADLAEKAAGLMNMRVLKVENDEVREIGNRLPRGRVFGSGRAFVPFLSNKTWAQLAPLAGFEVSEPIQPDEGAAAGDPAETASGGTANPGEAATPLTGDYLPTAWADIRVGALVLASEGPMEGFYEAVVVAEPGPDLFKVKFRDFPDEPLMVRKREHLALLHLTDSGRT